MAKKTKSIPQCKVCQRSGYGVQFALCSKYGFGSVCADCEAKTWYNVFDAVTQEFICQTSPEPESDPRIDAPDHGYIVQEASAILGV